MIIFNRYLAIGIGLFILGLILTPVIVGVPILVAGLLIGNFGVFYGITGLVPGLHEKMSDFFKTVIVSYQPYFHFRNKEKEVRKK